MSQSDLTNRLNEAIRLVNEGNREEARAILMALSNQYPQVEQVWMWLATATDDTADRAQYLRKVLSINPKNEKARAALTRLTGETVAQEADDLRPRASSESNFTTRRLESWLIAILGLIVIILVILAIVVVVPPLLTPHPTATATPTHTPTATLQYSLTPSITPGGPTDTPFVPQTLPPTWTPSATAKATLTRTPADTATITPTSTETPTFVVITRPPTITPGGPSWTPEPPTETATPFNAAEITAIPSITPPLLPSVAVTPPTATPLILPTAQSQ